MEVMYFVVLFDFGIEVLKTDGTKSNKVAIDVSDMILVNNLLCIANNASITFDHCWSHSTDGAPIIFLSYKYYQNKIYILYR